MREIKFRGKRLEDGVWFYGSVNVYPDEGCKIVSPVRLVGYFPATEVDPATVGQFTELKDKNGVDIYEGDIVKQKESSSGVIQYSLGEWIVTLYDNNIHDRLNECYKYETVIGNIHDNPELL